MLFEFKILEFQFLCIFNQNFSAFFSCFYIFAVVVVVVDVLLFCFLLLLLFCLVLFCFVLFFVLDVWDLANLDQDDRR